MRRDFIWIVLIGFAIGCGITDSAPGPTELYVQNASPFTMEGLVVNDWHIGDLDAGGVSGPRTFSTVYSYGAVAMIVQGDTLRLQPIDFVGEEPLGRGEFTYVLTLGGDSLQRWIKIEVVEGSVQRPVRGGLSRETLQ